MMKAGFRSRNGPAHPGWLRASPTPSPRFALLAALAALVLLVSCRSVGRSDPVHQAVAAFHRQLDSEQWRSIYSEADDEFRQGGTEQDFRRLIEAVHRKLGNVQAAQMRDYKQTWIAGQGTFVVFTCQTKFAGGEAIETFAWRMSTPRPILHGYNINSNALVLK